MCCLIYRPAGRVCNDNLDIASVQAELGAEVICGRVCRRRACTDTEKRGFFTVNRRHRACIDVLAHGLRPFVCREARRACDGGVMAGSSHTKEALLQSFQFQREPDLTNSRVAKEVKLWLQANLTSNGAYAAVRQHPSCKKSHIAIDSWLNVR